MFDTIIQGGILVDGSGAPGVKNNVGIREGRIAAIGKLKGPAGRLIPAAGRIVAPGFIDMHSHSDFALLANPNAESKIRQGVTTEVIGNCGESAAPVRPERLELVRQVCFDGSFDLDWNWLSLKEYCERLGQQGTAVNVAPLIGHGTIRTAVMGMEKRPPSPAELEEMKALIREAMQEGAFGLSTGLIYTPSSYSTTAELVALAAEAGRSGGIYASHIRGEAETLLAAVTEAIEIGRKAGLPVQISHHKAVGKENWGRVEHTLRMIDEANAEGLEVSADQYPYTASSNSLSAALPGWMHEGGPASMLRRLEDPEVQKRLRQEIVVREGYWEDTRIAGCKGHREYEGMSLQQIAERLGKDPFQAFFDLLREEEGKVQVVCFGMCEQDLRTVMRHPRVMVGSDAEAKADYGPLSQGKPHPRSYGTFPRVLGRYVREQKVIGLEEAIRKMTSLPAAKLGLADRGLIREGMWADLTIFDPDSIEDRATYQEPHRYPAGIDWVLVAGEVVVEKGAHTGRRPGRILSRR